MILKLQTQARFYIDRSLSGAWLVLDRSKLKLIDDEVTRFDNRREARAKARELNIELSEAR